MCRIELEGQTHQLLHVDPLVAPERGETEASSFAAFLLYLDLVLLGRFLVAQHRHYDLQANNESRLYNSLNEDSSRKM